MKNSFPGIPAFLSAFLVATGLFCLGTTAHGRSLQAKLAPVDLRCDDLKNPAGLDHRDPVFSWLNNLTSQGNEQATYEILVASSQQNLDANNGDLWDSGHITSGQSTQVSYAGKPLTSGEADRRAHV